MEFYILEFLTVYCLERKHQAYLSHGPQTCQKVGYGVSREPGFFVENDTREKREEEAQVVATQLRATYTTIRVHFLFPCSFPPNHA